ncbi:unnamed protein product [Pleuronectes platessa]|uniref:Uncharacterized protein n=1 Tax=Pleuronectes platessa TaxID=8262 RepID=A0A9N7YJA5_PLEPL|nr:unnamed protein product [Pleuronectes platessa]
MSPSAPWWSDAEFVLIRLMFMFLKRGEETWTEERGRGGKKNERMEVDLEQKQEVEKGKGAREWNEKERNKVGEKIEQQDDGTRPPSGAPHVSLLHVSLVFSEARRQDLRTFSRPREEPGDPLRVRGQLSVVKVSGVVITVTGSGHHRDRKWTHIVEKTPRVPAAGEATAPPPRRPLPSQEFSPYSNGPLPPQKKKINMRWAYFTNQRGSGNQHRRRAPRDEAAACQRRDASDDSRLMKGGGTSGRSLTEQHVRTVQERSSRASPHNVQGAHGREQQEILQRIHQELSGRVDEWMSGREDEWTKDLQLVVNSSEQRNRTWIFRRRTKRPDAAATAGANQQLPLFMIISLNSVNFKGQGTGDRGQETGDRGQTTGDRQTTDDRQQETGDRGQATGKGDRRQGAGDRRQTTDDRRQTTGDRGQRTGDRDRGQGAGDRGQGQGTGDRGQGTGDRRQTTDDRRQTTGDRGQGTEDRATGDRGQGAGDRGQGTGDRGQGAGDRAQGTDDRRQTTGDRGQRTGDSDLW